MSHTKLATRLTLAAGALVLVAACAPKDQALTDKGARGGGGTSGGGGGTVANFSLDERKLQVARHALVKLGQSRRMIELALAIPSRGATPFNAKLDLADGCRSIVRENDGVADDQVSVVERLLVQSKNCSDTPAKDSKLGTAVGTRNGVEKYAITYNGPVPKYDDANKVFPYPLGITVTSKEMATKLQQKSHKNNFILIQDSYTLTATLAPQAGDEAAGVLTYQVSWEGSEDVTSDIKLVLKKVLGTSTHTALFKVDKNTRKVVEISGVKMVFGISGTQFDKSDYNGSQLTPSKPSSDVLVFQVDNALKLSADSCVAPEGTFSANRDNAPVTNAVQVAASGGKISVDGGEGQAIGLCAAGGNAKEAPLFVEDLEGVYN